jgi:hypothetical protein
LAYLRNFMARSVKPARPTAASDQSTLIGKKHMLHALKTAVAWLVIVIGGTVLILGTADYYLTPAKDREMANCISRVQKAAIDKTINFKILCTYPEYFFSKGWPTLN